MVLTFLNFARFRREDDVDDKTLDLGAEDRKMYSKRRRCILYLIWCQRSEELPVSFFAIVAHFGMVLHLFIIERAGICNEQG